MALRVVFAEDNYLVREGTTALLSESDRIDVVATAEDLDGLMTAVDAERPDAALRIRREHPEIGVVVLSQYVEGAYAFDLLRDGAAGLGYLLKERVADVAEVVRALEEVARGGSVLDPKVVEELVAEKRRQADSPLGGLTEREREVLEQMAQGKNNASIAKALFLTERAVEKHINSLFHKLDLTEETDGHRRVMAVLAFLRATGSTHDGG